MKILRHIGSVALMMGRARAAPSSRMIAQAVEIRADAIINVRYMTTSVVGSAG
jgi:uncharacterized protein YbjQ (UPF0145 family)